MQFSRHLQGKVSGLQGNDLSCDEPVIAKIPELSPEQIAEIRIQGGPPWSSHRESGLIQVRW